MKNLKTLFLLCILAGSVLIACKKSKKITETTYSYSVTLAGTNEVPVNTSTATGTFSGSYTKSNKLLAFTLSYSGMTPTDWHIHKAAVGVNGAVVFPLNPIVPSPLTTSITLTSDQEADLLAGNYYVNIHSSTYPGGEIRAQLAAPVVVIDYDDGY